MKKILSLLSIITISGNTIPTTIAASPYQKQEQKIKLENNNINYSQINNLENLNRIKRQSTNISYHVTTMYTFNEDDGNHKKGDILFGTTNGIYLRKAGESTTTKINGIDKEVSLIQLYPNNENYPANFGSAHVITLDGSIYYLRGGDNVVFLQSDVPYSVTTMYTFNEDDGNHKKGDILFGTTNGIYLRKAGESTTTKINEINESKKITNIFNIKKQLIKGLIFNFKEININSKIKKIENINYYLNFSDIEVTKNKDSIFFPVIDIKDVCFNKKNPINNSKIIKSFKIHRCLYKQKEKIEFQIIKGISKYGQESINNEWDLNYTDENKIRDFLNINNINIEIKHVLSDNFNSLNIGKQEKESIINYYDEPEDEIQLAPNERALIKYSVRKITLKSILNLKQKINGWINAKIITENNEEKMLSLSLKEIMEILKKHNLLPIEININNDNDNNIIFNGKAFASQVIEGKPKLTFNTFLT